MDKMMSKEHAEGFLVKIDMEGFDYAVENYAPKNTGDAKFDKILETLYVAQKEMVAYIEELREEYGIEEC